MVVLFLLGLALLWCFTFFVTIALYHRDSNINLRFRDFKTILLVIAHPDDESMFFSPTLYNLSSVGCKIYIVCLSTGNAYGIGKIRTKELINASAVFKIPWDHIEVVDHPQLKDGFSQEWPDEFVSNFISNFQEKWNVTNVGVYQIITFDREGVSGHPNHKALYFGLMYLKNCHNEKIKCWSLKSERIIFKFLGPLNAIFQWVSQSPPNSICFLNPEPRRVLEAMRAHASQWVWFRWLFVVFSSYTYANTLVVVDQ